ncbi:zinc finger-like protein, partial [Trifolium pratense]
RSWKAFKDKLRLKRAGSAWTSSIHIPTSDIPIQNPNSRTFSQFGRRDSVRVQSLQDSDMSAQAMTHQVEDLDPSNESNAPVSKPQFTRKSSTRLTGDSPESLVGGRNLRTLSRTNSSSVSSEPFRRERVVTFRDSFDDDEPGDDSLETSSRGLSAREAVAAQEAAEAAAEEEEAEAGPPTMSLMDLLGETDRELGLEGSRYILSDEDEDDDYYDDDEEDEDGESALEQTCCICMVKHKGAALAACGHSFCRMCSRELMVAKGNCPLCNNFILEILDIF